jgi:hypothetical protein
LVNALLGFCLRTLRLLRRRFSLLFRFLFSFFCSFLFFSLFLRLFGFNLGVELGQLVALVAILAAGRLVRSLAAAPRRALAADALSAALCALGVLWFVVRAYG